MSDLRAFFTLIGRDAFFWLAALGLGCLSIFLVAINQPHAPPVDYIDAFILASFAYPALAGWLAGAMVQEVQTCTFTWTLPDVQPRISRGFFTFGAIVTVIVVTFASLQGSPYNLLVLGAIGLAGYSFGANYYGRVTWHRTWLATIFSLAVLFSSRGLGGLASTHPGSTALVALASAGYFSYGLLSVSTFRKGRFRLPTPLPGAFFLQRSQRFERQKQAVRKSPTRGWRSGYLGNSPWNWVRAGLHETYGPLTFGVVGRAIASTWVLWLLVAIHAWVERVEAGEQSFSVALGKTLYDVLLRSPDIPPYGEEGPYAMVVFVIAALGAILCLKASATPNSGVLYPLSRKAFAGVAFRGGQVEASFYFIAIFVGFLLVGLVAGALVGYETRLDFLPFFVRPLMATTILLPLPQYGRLRMQSPARQRDQNAFLLVAGGVIGFVTLVSIWTYFAPQVFRTSQVEITAFLVLLLISRLLYWAMVKHHFISADLA